MLAAKTDMDANTPPSALTSRYAFVCPHCRQRTIGIMAKMLSRPHAPALCYSCGGYSSEPMGPTYVMAFAAHAGFLAACWAALVYGSFWPFAILIVAWIACVIIGVRIIPLAPITDAVAAREYRLHIFFVAVFVLIILVMLISGKS